MKAVHFGAGSIGRGFIGLILHQNDFSVTFLDTNKEIVEQLKKDKKYDVELLDSDDKIITVTDVDAINSIENTDEAIDAIFEADIVTTSVGANNLSKIAPLLKKALLKRGISGIKTNILANENIINASDMLKEKVFSLANESEKNILEKNTYFVNTAIDRQSFSKEIEGKIISLVEPYFEWIMDGEAFDPETAFKLKNVKYVSDLKPYIERKLFLVNACHASLAYLGSLLGYTTVQEAAKNEKVKKVVLGFLNENKEYFVQKYKMEDDKLSEFIMKTFKRHGNPMLSDEVTRVGRAPLRKLTNDDRLVAPVVNLNKMGKPHEYGIRVIASAFHFFFIEDIESVELRENISKNGIFETIISLSKIDDEDLVRIIGTKYLKINDNPINIFY